MNFIFGNKNTTKTTNTTLETHLNTHTHHRQVVEWKVDHAR